MQLVARGFNRCANCGWRHASLYFLPLPQFPGRVGLTFAPGKCDGIKWQRSMAADLDRLAKHYRVAHLISLIEDHELAYYRIEDLYMEAQRRGGGTGDRSRVGPAHAA